MHEIFVSAQQKIRLWRKKNDAQLLIFKHLLASIGVLLSFKTQFLNQSEI